MINRFVRYILVFVSAILILTFAVGFLVITNAKPETVKSIIEKEINNRELILPEGESDNINNRSMQDVKKEFLNIIPKVITLFIGLIIFLGVSHQLAVRLGLIKGVNRNENN